MANGKFSEQTGGTQFLGRTARLQQQQRDAQQSQIREREIDDARQKLSQAVTIEEYEQIYSTLSSFQKSAFPSPQDLRNQQEAKKQADIATVRERISELEAKQRSAEERNRQKNENNTLSRDDQRSFEDLMSDISTNLSALYEGVARLERGDPVSAEGVISYASELTAYRQDRREANRAQRAREKATPTLKDNPYNFNFTGIVQESNVDQKTGKETKVGTKFFERGVEVSAPKFAENYQVFQKQGGSLLIVPKGTNLSNLTPEQQRVFFPEEFESKTFSAQQVQATQSQVQTTAPKTTLFSKIYQSEVAGFKYLGKTLPAGFRFFSDVLGSIIPDTSLSGGSSLEATTVSEEELKTRRKNILAKTFSGLGLFSISGGGASTGFTGKAPKPLGIVEADVESFKLRRDIYKGSLDAKKIQAIREIQISEITGAQTQLNEINDRINSLNQEISQKPSITPTEAEQINKEYGSLIDQRTNILQGLRSKGVQTIETGETITFSSPELEADISSSAVKEFRGKSKGQKALAITDVVAQEIGENALLGYGLGASGVLTKGGSAFIKLTGLRTIITRFPKSTKLTIEGATAGAVLLTTILRGNKAGGQFRAEGASYNEGFLLGAGITAGKAGGFALGAKFGTDLYTQRIINRVERGGFTRTSQEEINVGGRKIKIPAEKRIEEIREVGTQSQRAVRQQGSLETKIPETDIKIQQTYKIEGRYEQQGQGVEGGDIIAKITKGQAPYQSGAVAKSRIFLAKKAGSDETGIILLTEKKSGISVDQFRTISKIENFKVLNQAKDGTQTVFVDFRSPIIKVGDTVFLKGAKSVNIDDLKKVIDVNRLFTTFAGEDKLFAVSRTQQITKIYPKQIAGVNPAGEVGTFQITKTIGSSRSARVDALKSVLRLYEVKQSPEIFGIVGKKGQLTIPFSETAPDTVITAFPKSQLKIPTFESIKDLSALQLSAISKDLAPLISSEIGLKSSVGIDLAIAGNPLRISQGGQNRNLQSEIARLIQFDIQQPRQDQPGAQTSGSRLQQAPALQQLPALEQAFAFSPSPPSPPTRTTPSAPTGLGIDLDFLLRETGRKLQKKSKSKRVLGYTPDFTSKIIDLPVQKVSQKQAMKLINQVQTGAEVRVPIQVRNILKQKRMR